MQDAGDEYLGSWMCASSCWFVHASAPSQLRLRSSSEPGAQACRHEWRLYNTHTHTSHGIGKGMAWCAMFFLFYRTPKINRCWGPSRRGICIDNCSLSAGRYAIQFLQCPSTLESNWSNGRDSIIVRREAQFGSGTAQSPADQTLLVVATTSAD